MSGARVKLIERPPPEWMAKYGVSERDLEIAAAFINGAQNKQPGEATSEIAEWSLAAMLAKLRAESRAPLEARVRALQDTMAIAIDLLDEDVAVRGMLENALGKEVSEEAKRAGAVAQRNADQRGARLKELEARVAELEKERDAWKERSERLEAGNVRMSAAVEDVSGPLSMFDPQEDRIRRLGADRDRWREAALRRWPRCEATVVTRDSSRCVVQATGRTKSGAFICDACAVRLRKATIPIEDAALIREHAAAGKGAAK